MIRKIYRILRAHVLHYVIPQSKAALFPAGKTAVEVVGFFHSPSGIGESARLCAKQLQQNGYKVLCTSIENAFLKPKEMDWDFADNATAEEIGCRIIHLNPSMMPPMALKMGLKRYASVFNIGYWAWELERIPAEWERALRYVNAIFCPSEFTSKAIRHYTQKPVITVPHPVFADAATTGMREKLDVADSTFLVASVFSFGSALERKNPHALIDAFQQAFSEDDDACLILKSNHGGDSPDKKLLLERMKSHKNIRIIDDVWDKADVLGLIKAADIYASLHRSEGFGLPIAEAMRQGTAPMVTNWSGNVDFCTHENSFLIDYRMVALQSEHAEFKALTNLQWADANAEHAATLLRQAFENREILQQKADACLLHTNAYFSEPGYVRALSALNAK
jgi:glycosyltransferase involved in cell wall biosynthesis